MFLSTLYLLLAHLVADFLLQPESLVRWKHKSTIGLAIHAAIHWFVMLALLAPFGLDKVILVVTGILAMAHFAVDWAKITLEPKLKLYYQLFVVDQTIHLLLILVAGYLLSGFVSMQTGGSVFLDYYSNEATILGLCIVIIATYAYELGAYQLQREYSPKAVFKPDFRAMLKRLILSSIIYGLLMIFGVYQLAAFGG